jgi:cystine transport system substrate-binding protein
MGRLAVLAALVGGALLLAGCSAPARDEGQLRFAVDPHHAPLASLDLDDRPVGFEIDLARALALKLGKSARIDTVPTQGLVQGVAWAGILSGLDRNETDVVLSAVTESNFLRERWALSEPYLNPGPVLVFRTGAAPRPLGPDTIATLGLTGGGKAEAEVRRAAVSSWRLRFYRDAASALEDLADGQLDAVASDRIGVAGARVDSERLGLLTSPTAPLTSDEPLVMVVRKDDEALRADLNRALADLRADGTLAQLERRWGL